jgi:uncharacterized protein
VVGNSDAPHLPHPAPIDAYGKGGFRFAGMSHRGSLLCLPQGIWPWPIAVPHQVDATALTPVFASTGAIELFILGTGREPWVIPEVLRARFREARMVVDVMTTGPAVRTYNILLGERRRIAAGLIAVE